MSELSLLDRCAVVAAHPDDEVLWASSILAEVERIVICFGEVAFKPELSEGRRQAMAAFPLEQVSWLEIPESSVYKSAAWPLPAESPYGLAVQQRLHSMRGFSEARYRENFARLREILARDLAGCRNVVTHNPWGEYGHEEHVQVFRAVESLQRELGFTLWVSCYCSNRSAALMQQYLPRLGTPTPPLPTDRALGTRLQAHYTETNCWTFVDDYVWPDREVFYPWLPEPDPVPHGMPVRQINFLWLDKPFPKASDRSLLVHLRWSAGRVARKLGLHPRPSR
jgi:LmbE family N-acetylglucosaminyl deacetylase